MYIIYVKSYTVLPVYIQSCAVMLQVN